MSAYQIAIAASVTIPLRRHGATDHGGTGYWPPEYRHLRIRRRRSVSGAAARLPFDAIKPQENNFPDAILRVVTDSSVVDAVARHLPRETPSARYFTKANFRLSFAQVK